MQEGVVKKRDGIRSVPGKIGNGIKKFFIRLGGVFENTDSKVGAFIDDKIVSNMYSLAEGISDKTARFSSILDTGSDALVIKAESLVENIDHAAESLEGKFHNVSEIFSELGDKGAETIREIGEKIGNGFNEASSKMNQINNKYSGKSAGSITEKFDKINSRLKNATGSINKKIEQKIENIK